MASDFLAQVRRRKEERLRERPAAPPAADLDRLLADAPPVRPFAAALAARRPAIIGEVKRRSPSAGALAAVDDPGATAAAMVRGGAAAISVLTDAEHFGGCLRDLAGVRALVDVPVLRKDFLIHPRDLAEARLAGADAALLIVALLSAAELGTMLAEAARLGLEALVEVHTREELTAALGAGAGLVGINNRNLHTLAVDRRTVLDLLPLVPPGITPVALSGYRGAEDLAEARAAGVNAFLIGETLMRAGDPEEAVRGLVSAAAVGERR